jgi:hypothetical protein
MGAVIDMAEWDGDAGRWTILGPDPDRRPGYWLCRCSCGTESSVRGAKIRDGSSAGCVDCGPSVPRPDAIRRRRGFGRPAIRGLCADAEREGWVAARLIAELRKLTEP